MKFKEVIMNLQQHAGADLGPYKKFVGIKCGDLLITEEMLLSDKWALVWTSSDPKLLKTFLEIRDGLKALGSDYIDSEDNTGKYQ